MIVALKSILHEPRNFDFVLEPSWWQDNEYGRILKIDHYVKVQISIYKDEDKYVFEGSISGGVLIRCDRCLENYRSNIKEKFRLVLAVHSAETEQKEYELLEEDMEVEFITGDNINLDNIIREQIYLSLPIKSLCRTDCSGLCHVCGVNLNKGKCKCKKGEGNPAFLKLKALKFIGE